MNTYIATAQVGDMVTDVTFNARSDRHALKVADRHGWDLLGELMLADQCDDVPEALLQQHYETIH